MNVEIALKAKGQQLPTLAPVTTTPVCIHSKVLDKKISLPADEETRFSLFWLDRSGEVRSTYVWFEPFRVDKGEIKDGTFLDVSMVPFVCDICLELLKSGRPGDEVKYIPSCRVRWCERDKNNSKEKKGKKRRRSNNKELTCRYGHGVLRPAPDMPEMMPDIPSDMKQRLMAHVGQQHNAEVLPEVFGVFPRGKEPVPYIPMTEVADILANRYAKFNCSVVPYTMFAGQFVPKMYNLVVACRPESIGAVDLSALIRNDQRLPDDPHFRAYKTRFIPGRVDATRNQGYMA